jgi:leader peptidase (prepilin peptidase) / N-methyltransferase
MLYLLCVVVFVVGVAVGAVVHFCADRLSYEKSILWPGPRCPSCVQPIRWYDNIPLVSYWLLGRRCRTCGAIIPASHFAVELCTGLAFIWLFYLEIVCNVLKIPLLAEQQQQIAAGQIEGRIWLVFVWHSVLVGFLLLTSLCDLQHLEIPLSITLTGTLVGLIGATLLPWPFPNDQVRMPPALPGFLAAKEAPRSGLYPWPVWSPLPAWLPAGSWQLGLATGLAGALAGMVVLRGVRFLFGLGRGIEGMGMGDADLMMMAGSFLGWQPILLAFFAGVIPALFFGIVQLVRKGDQPIPFGPSLAIGAVLTLLCWPALGGQFAIILFEWKIVAGLVVVGAVFLLATSYMLRLIRGT